ncbi:MAG: carbamate kinase [Deltaproteobacteria bacterium]|nr:carbamate kinase [Deltaproteobacteria bacterium]
MTTDAFLLAMGGNSLIDRSLPPTVENQFAITSRAVAPVAELMARGLHMVITHGNGPQVGFMQLRQHLAREEVHQVPLDSLVADSQGALGYMIQRDLREHLRRLATEAGSTVEAEVATLVTEVRVDPNDPEMQNPRKPVGQFYTKDESEALTRERGWAMVEDSGRGYRRVVPSPFPLEIVQLATIRRLADQGVTVIACGGGGIPVVRVEGGTIRGIEGVIDKDRTSALLANLLGLKRMIITTGVERIFRGFRSGEPEAIEEIRVSELRALADAGEFPPGSMGPKVEAALTFLERGGQEVTICRPEDLCAGYEHRAGTTIRHD